MSSCYGDSVTRKKYCLSTFMVMLLLMLVLLWSVFGSLARKEFETGSSEAQLFLACLVGPFGVWTRWYLARLNGRGLGRKGVLKWMPFGTLAANVTAACVMAALATLKKAVRIHLRRFLASTRVFSKMSRRLMATLCAGYK